MTKATEGGMIASRSKDSSVAPLMETPWPLAIAPSIDDLGKSADLENQQLYSSRIHNHKALPFFAFAIAVANLGLLFGSGPKPISRASI